MVINIEATASQSTENNAHLQWNIYSKHTLSSQSSGAIEKERTAGV